MFFNKVTTLIVALSFVFVGEAFAHRHGRHSEGNGEESSPRARRHFHPKRNSEATHQKRRCFRERIQGDKNSAPQERRHCRRGTCGAKDTLQEKRTFKHNRRSGKPTVQRRGRNFRPEVTPQTSKTIKRIGRSRKPTVQRRGGKRNFSQNRRAHKGRTHRNHK